MTPADYIWSEACDVCEGSGRAIRWYPATWYEPADYDYDPFRQCTACDGTGAMVGEPLTGDEVEQ